VSWLTGWPGRRRRAVAAEIALQRLLELAAHTADELLSMVDELEQVVMAADGQPYLVTAWVVVGPDGTVWITVEVDAAVGRLWAHPVTRTATVLPGDRSASTVDIHRTPPWG